MVKVARTDLLLFAIAGAASAAPGFAKDNIGKVQPQLEVQPIFASDLLAIAEPRPDRRTPRFSLIDAERSGLVEQPPYRLEREGNAVTGKRAKLSIAVGTTRFFALSGKLSRRERPGPPEAVEFSRTNVLGPRKLESGRLYGGGVERRFGPVDVSAAYQYSRINGAELNPASLANTMRIDDSGKSHGVQLRAQLRF